MKGWKQAGITAAVAYALALQALLLSFGGALHAGAANLPQAIICLPSQQPAPDHAPVDAHDSLCCILSCNASVPPAGPVPALAFLDRPPSVPNATGIFRPAPFLRLASNVLPVGSRAPPRLG
jgi:hypothetical protein